MKDWGDFNILNAYVNAVVGEYDQVPAKRKEELEILSESIKSVLEEKGKADLLFICTHNSRRSHMAQLWAQLASWYHGQDQVCCYSGGTEATAFEPRAIRSMQDAGFTFKTHIIAANKVYKAGFPGSCKDNRVFSKKYTEPPNPTKGFIAVMVCSDADEGCPVVFGASHRHAIRYADPKEFDGSPEEAAGYAERCRQIAREMFFLFSRLEASS